jgi:hypothetical protein
MLYVASQTSPPGCDNGIRQVLIIQANTIHLYTSMGQPPLDGILWH